MSEANTPAGGEELVGTGASGSVWRVRGHPALVFKQFESKDVFERERDAMIRYASRARYAVCGIADDRQWRIYMPYCPGPNLETSIAQRKLCDDERKHILACLREFQEDMKLMGMDHGDFKAKNIVLVQGRQGALRDPLVVDFDLCKRRGAPSEDETKLIFLEYQLEHQCSYLKALEALDKQSYREALEET